MTFETEMTNSRLRSFLGIIIFAVAGFRILFEIGGDTDFALAHIENPGWLSSVYYLLISPPRVILLPFFLLGLMLIFWDKISLIKQRRNSKVAPTLLIIFSMLGFGIGTIWLVRSQISTVMGSQIFLTAPPVEHREGTPLNWWKGASVDAIYIPTSSDVTFSLLRLAAKNIGDKEINVESIYMISRITGQKKVLDLSTGNEPIIPVNEANPIPPGAVFNAVANFVPNTTQSGFLSAWGDFDLIARYEGVDHRINFPIQTTEKIVGFRNPAELSPKVTRRIP